MDRAAKLALHCALLAIAATVTYCWCVRISDDLSRDESTSYRRYAHHPVTAVALYREPNNHPLESLFKSLFYELLDLDDPPFFRFPGFVVMLGFLAAAWRWHVFLTARGSVFAAAVLTVLIFLGRAIFEQGLVMRGYFPTIVLELVWFLLLARWSGILDRDGPAGARAPPAITRRIRLSFAMLSAVLLFLLPSNLALLLVLWPATAMAFGGPHVLRETVRLAALGGVLGAVLYVPIVVTILWVTGKPQQIPAYPVEDVLSHVISEAVFAFRQCQPAGWNDWLFGGLCGMLMAGALVLARRKQATRVAWCLILGVLLLFVVVAVLFDYPPRIKLPYAGPVVLGLTFLAHELASRWPARVQAVAALAVAGLGCTALPAIVESTRFDRRGSDLAAFLETRTHAAENRVLVAHHNADTLRPYLAWTFGATRTINGLAEWKQAVHGVELPEGRPVGRLERWITDLFFPRPAPRRIAPEEIDVLVLIGEKEAPAGGGGAVAWREPALDALKERLSRVSRYRRDLRDVEIYERP